MRGIKFRAQDYTGTWRYGFIVKGNEAAVIIPINPDGSAELGINIYVKPETIGQFIGLYDKNGKEVYEGDILLFKDLGPLWDDQTVVVEWSEFGARFETGGFNIRLCMDNEIIGNVFENKELLNNRMKDLNILHLPLKAKWYDMQERGEKTEEYREITPYWIKKLVDTHRLGKKMLCNVPNVAASLMESGCVQMKPYTHVLFRYGYTQRTFTSRIDSITIGRGKPEWGAPTDRDVFIIKHHREEV